MGLRTQARNHLHQARTTWAPSPVRRLLRHPAVRAGAIVAMGAIASLTWSARVAALDDERAQWGELTAVLVVIEPVAIGEPVAAAVEVREVPRVWAPPNALQQVAPEAVAKTALYIDEILLAERITHADALGPPPDTVALTLTTVATVPLIDQGDLIDVWTVDSANLSSRRIAHRVVVLSLAADGVTIAVPQAQVAETTAAALRPVVITLVG